MCTLIKRNWKTDGAQIAFSILLLLLAIGALGWEAQCLGLLVIVLADLFVMSLIVCAAIKSTPANAGGDWESWPYLPTRLAALILLPSLLVALVVAFGSLYLWTKGVYLGGKNGSLLTDHWDALYFSVVTITTLGYGDFLPVESCARWTVMGELASGIIMLVGALPLLVGRLTNWDR
jgi:Ion channel